MSYPKRLNVTFEIENQLQEYNLIKELEAKGGTITSKNDK